MFIRSAPTRFESYFPYASWLINNPLITGIYLLPIAMIAALVSIHYGLAVVLGWLTLVAYNWERRILEFCLFPPFATLMLWQFLGLGVGVSLIVSESSSGFDPIYLKMQLVWIIGFPLFYLSYSLVFRRITGVVVPIISNHQQAMAWQPLYYIGWILITYRIGGYVFGAYSGAEDRGDFSIAATSDATFGIWSLSQLIPRFNNIGFMLFPLLLARSNPLQRAILYLMLGVYFLLALVSGARGILFYPILFIGAGYYAFLQPSRKAWDLRALGLVVALVPLIYFMGAYRGNEGYTASKMIDVKSRLLALGQTRDSIRNQEITSDIGPRTVTGLALLGVQDYFVYPQTPELIPHAGWDGFNAVPLVWVPTFFMPDKPNLIDGNYIMSQYFDFEIGRGTAATISLPADLFRRFGWLGVGVGMPLAFVAYGALSYFCYAVFLHRNFVIGTILVLYTASFFSWSPLQTLLFTWWNFAYDLPRHLIVLLGLYVVAGALFGAKGTQGALHYWPMIRK